MADHIPVIAPYWLENVQTWVFDDPATDWDAACIGSGWLVQKAVAFGEAEVPVAAERIRQLSVQCELDMSGFTDDEAQYAWEIGQQKWQEAREEVVGWLPAVAATS